MKAARYIGVVNEWNQFIVGSALEVPVAFAQIYIDLNGMLDGRHRCCLYAGSVSTVRGAISLRAIVFEWIVINPTTASAVPRCSYVSYMSRYLPREACREW